MHLLAHHQDVQDKARLSIQEVLDRHNGEWCYDAIMEMTYLEQIIEESMRIYPPVAQIFREANEDYQLPNGAILPKGFQVVIPVLGLHRDPEIYPEPMRFDPNRFSREEKSKRHPFAFIPFGEGDKRHETTLLCF